MGVRNHMEQEARWKVGLERRGVTSGVEEALVEAPRMPRIVTVSARVFRGRGRIGSLEGRVISQFRVAPPEIAPRVRVVIGINREGILSSR